MRFRFVDALRRRCPPWGRGALRLLGHALTLWVTVRVFWVFNGALLHNPLGYDEQFFVWGGWSLTRGLAPYKEFLEFKPPFVFITHALALKLFGFRHLAFRRFFALFPLAAFLSLQVSLIRRKVDDVLAMTLVLSIIALFVGPAYHDTALTDSESIGLCYFLFGLAFLLFETKHNKITDTIGAALMTCSVFSKEPFAPVVLATWACVFMLREGFVGFRRKATRYIKFTGLGVAVVILGLCIYMVPTGAMAAYLRMTARYAHVYRDPSQSYCVLLGRFTPSTPMNELAAQWEKMRLDFLSFARLGYMAPLIAAGIVFTARRSLLLLAGTLTAFAAGLWAVTASNCQWLHYYSMTMAGLVTFLVVGLDTMKGSFWSCDRWMRWFVRVAAAAAMATAVYPRFDAEVGAVHVTPAIPEPVPGALSIIAGYTSPADRIFTTGPPILYVLANRAAAVRESTFEDEILGVYVGDTDEERLRPIHDELVKSMPKVFIMDPLNAPRKRRHDRTLFMPFLAEFKYHKLTESIYVRP